MDKKVLIVIDDSIYSKRAIQYAILMNRIIMNCHYVLFNVQPTISEYLIRDAHFSKRSRIALNKLMEKNRQESEKLLNDFKDFMIRKGVDKDKIDIVTQPRAIDIAKDILNFAKQNMYNAILIGKRGVSRLEEIFTHSISNALVEHIQTIPLWAVDGEVKSTKIAVAIDGSESALRTIDHVGFIFGDNPDIRITLLHVIPKLRDYCPIEFDEEKEIEDVVVKGDKQCIESFFIHAKKHFEDAGIKEYQYEIKELPSTVSIAKTIVSEIEAGDYGTLVLGKSGISESFFLGSVSRHCFHTITNCAVWIVP